jgi:hypothetical protein
MRTGLLVLAALTLGFAPAPLPKRHRDRDDRARLDGTWYVESVSYNGARTGGVSQGRGLSIMIHDRLVIRGESATFREAYPQAYTIRTFRAEGLPALDLSDSSRDLRLPAIYKREGSVLTLAINPHGRPRPLVFSGNAAQLVIVFRYEKP